MSCFALTFIVFLTYSLSEYDNDNQTLHIYAPANLKKMIIELPAGKAMAVQEQSKLSRRTMVITKVVDKDEVDTATMDQVINAQKDAETLGNQLREMRRHHAAYHETMNTQKQQINQLEADIKKYKDAIQNDAQQLQQVNDRINQLLEENQRLKERVNKYQQDDKEKMKSIVSPVVGGRGRGLKAAAARMQISPARPSNADQSQPSNCRHDVIP